jgi:hypothetical protein
MADQRVVTPVAMFLAGAAMLLVVQCERTFPKNGIKASTNPSTGSQTSIGLFLLKKKATATRAGYVQAMAMTAYAAPLSPPSNAIPVPIIEKMGSHGSNITHQTVSRILTVLVSGDALGKDASNTFVA